MNQSTFDVNKVVAAILTAALASAKSGSTPEDLIGGYRTYLSELLPKQQETSPDKGATRKKV